ncbi:MAG: DUF1648 domain-containing protein [Lewinella sp.]|nr:DUF1648 domain-containing protein [Lewinella sp.]
MPNEKKHWPAASSAEQTAEKLAIATLILLCLIPLFYFMSLPDRIPLHFDGTGTPDSWGSRYTIFILPGIAVVMYFLLSLFGKQHDMMNFPIQRTPENEEALIQLTRLQLRYTKVILHLLFIYLVWGIIRMSLEQADTLAMWPVFIFIGLILLMVLYYYREANKLQ